MVGGHGWGSGRGTWRSSSPISRAFPACAALLSRSSRLMMLMTSASSRFLDGSPSQVLKIRYGWNEALGVGRLHIQAHPGGSCFPQTHLCLLKRRELAQQASTKAREGNARHLTEFFLKQPPSS